jgi:hypothetical protein
MPVTHEIDRERDLLRTRATGLVTFDDLDRHITMEEADHALGLAELLDARGATTDISRADVQRLVYRTDALVRKGRFGALAIVTDDDVAYGMARMYQILCEELPVRIGVFRLLEPALAWLGASSGAPG